jgi:hypothetical protein
MFFETMNVAAAAFTDWLMKLRRVWGISLKV